MKERFLKHAYGKPLFFKKQKKAKASEAKTRFSCIIEAHEATRQRIESATKRIHEEHIAGKGQNSVLHYNLVWIRLPKHKWPKSWEDIEDPVLNGHPLAGLMWERQFEKHWWNLVGKKFQIGNAFRPQKTIILIGQRGCRQNGRKEAKF